jgi:hypothetical protein
VVSAKSPTLITQSSDDELSSLSELDEVDYGESTGGSIAAGNGISDPVGTTVVDYTRNETESDIPISERILKSYAQHSIGHIPLRMHHSQAVLDQEVFDP